ncbi:sensor histidine kinase [Microbacterium sp. TL13]|uniref:sensor histidine kinase n=1 Tax=unclassified Microbacterium TaxID=2609290 RepID=UPI001588F671
MSVLSTDDLVLIVTTTLVCTLIVIGGGVVLLRVTRGAPILVKLTIVLVAAVAAVVVSTVAAAGEMFLGSHELIVVIWIVGVSAVVSTASAWFVLHRTVRQATAGLVSSARQIAAGGVVAPLASGWQEFDRVAIELADTAEKLSAARAEVERLESARRQFFAWISHDLRTPLSGIRALAEALEDGMAPDPGEYVTLIRTKVDTVDRMVDDLFELSKIDGGTLALHPQTVSLLDLVSDAVIDVSADAAARGVRITHDGIEGCQLRADPRELTRAISNVLSNGVRHAPEGSVVTVSATVADDGHLVLSVRDAGEGVAEEDLGRLFETGWRADAARSSDPARGATPGAGLGLAIVRGIAVAHGGSVRAARERDGFRLDLVLPATAVDRATAG